MGDERTEHGARGALRRIKRRDGLTAAQLADAAGLSTRTVEGFLSGRHSMPLDRLEKMLDELGYKLIIEPK